MNAATLLGAWGRFVISLASLRVVDFNGDGQIAASEFWHYVSHQQKVNQRWLYHALEHDPCTIMGAVAHYNHTLVYGALTEKVREAARGTRSHSATEACANCRPGEDLVGNGCGSWCSSANYCGHTKAYHHVNCDPEPIAPAGHEKLMALWSDLRYESDPAVCRARNF